MHTNYAHNMLFRNLS